MTRANSALPMFMGESSEKLRRLRYAAQIGTILLRSGTRANPAFYDFGHSVNRTAVIENMRCYQRIKCVSLRVSCIYWRLYFSLALLISLI